MRGKKYFGKSFIQRTNHTLKVSPSSIHDTGMDLTKDLTLYCPVNIQGKPCGKSGTKLRYHHCSMETFKLNSKRNSGKGKAYGRRVLTC